MKSFVRIVLVAISISASIVGATTLKCGGIDLVPTENNFRQGFELIRHESGLYTLNYRIIDSVDTINDLSCEFPGRDHKDSQFLFFCIKRNLRAEKSSFINGKINEGAIDKVLGDQAQTAYSTGAAGSMFYEKGEWTISSGVTKALTLTFPGKGKLVSVNPDTCFFR